MGDRTHVTLTLLRGDYDRVKDETWFDDGQVEDQGIPLPSRGNRNLNDADAKMAIEYDEVNYGDLGFLDHLIDRGVAFDSDWGRGGDYGPGCTSCRFTEEGELQLLNLDEGEENPPIGQLMSRITKPLLLVEYVRQYHKEHTPLPWRKQTDYGKRYLARKLLEPKEES